MTWFIVGTVPGGTWAARSSLGREAAGGAGDDAPARAGSGTGAADAAACHSAIGAADAEAPVNDAYDPNAEVTQDARRRVRR